MNTTNKYRWGGVVGKPFNLYQLQWLLSLLDTTIKDEFSRIAISSWQTEEPEDEMHKHFA